MALNYDPQLNRYRAFRFKGADYTKMSAERPQDLLTMEEYGELSKVLGRAWMIELFTLGATLIAQFALSKSRLFRVCNGYVRTTSRVGLVFLPWFYQRSQHAHEVETLYNHFIASKLNALYEAPISLKLASN